MFENQCSPDHEGLQATILRQIEVAVWPWGNDGAGFLASPPIVVAFALAGTVDTDITKDPIGVSTDGRPVFLADVWPTSDEIDEALTLATRAEDFEPAFQAAEESAAWADLPAPTTTLFPWDESSTYIRRPPFASMEEGTRLGEYDAHPILVLGDDITTDHISPAGAISPKGDAGHHLVDRGADPKDLNVFSSRRGNWEVMIRGLFTNRTVRNLLADGLDPGTTVHAPSGRIMSLWEASQAYRSDGESVVVVAGERYGMGSSRDWAAKGVGLVGARAVLASSFERIHRWNLIGMGVLPMRLPGGVDPMSLQLHPGDTLRIVANPEHIAPRCPVRVVVEKRGGKSSEFVATAAIETLAEVDILRAGGILPLILRSHMEK